MSNTPIKDGVLTGSAVLKPSSTLTIQGSLVMDTGSTLSLLDSSVGWGKVSKSGSSLADLATRNASDVTNVPYGSILSTNVQAALNELDDQLLSVEQTLTAYVTNAESVAITRGQVVYLFGASGDRASVKLASNVSESTSSKTFGIVKDVSISAGGTGYITCQGTVTGINLGSFVAGQTVYLGATPGTFTAAKPSAPAHLVYVGVVQRANSGNGILYVKVQNGYELDEIHDVSISSPSNGQALIYDSATSLWKNTTIVTVPTWGSITGTLSDQTDLQNALNAKASTSSLGSLAFLSSISNSNWSGTQLALANGGTGATTQAGAANAILPSQTSNSGKYLTTDGTNVSWGTVASGATWGNITGTLSDQTDLQNALNAKASLSGATFTGGIVSTLGSITTSTPMLSGTQQWTGGGTFTGLKLNVTDTSSASGSLLLDLQKGGTSQFKVDKSGKITVVQPAWGVPSIVFPSGYSLYDTSGGTGGLLIRGGSTMFCISGYGAVLSSGFVYGWASTPDTQASDTGLGRNAAGVVEINNGTAGTFRDLTLRSLLPASGTITADTPLISGTQTWNNSGVNFTALKLNVTNTASGASSNLLDLQVGGTSKVKVDKDGFLTAQYVNAGARVVFGSGSGGIFWNGSSMNLAGAPVETDQNFWLRNSSAFLIIGGSSSPQLTWDANYTIGQRNGTNAQLYKLYNTYTSATNYERLGLNWATNVAQIYTEKGSGGGTARDLVLGTNATTAITISGTDQSVTTAAALSDNIGNVRSIPQNAQTSAYVLAATDNGKHISITTGGVTVNSGIFSAGQVVVIYNNSSSNQTITQGTSVTMYQGGTTNTGNRTLASYGVATILCVASNTFVITGSGLS